MPVIEIALIIIIPAGLRTRHTTHEKAKWNKNISCFYVYCGLTAPVLKIKVGITLNLGSVQHAAQIDISSKEKKIEYKWAIDFMTQ